MNSLTKKYRLIWDSNKLIVGDPFVDATNSTTLVNTGNYFESDDVGDIQPKIDELELELPPESPPKHEDISPYFPPDPDPS